MIFPWKIKIRQIIDGALTGRQFKILQENRPCTTMSLSWCLQMKFVCNETSVKSPTLFFH